MNNLYHASISEDENALIWTPRGHERDTTDTMKILFPEWEKNSSKPTFRPFDHSTHVMQSSRRH
jgi:hypothetical protein